jgi:hypothetical protein
MTLQNLLISINTPLFYGWNGHCTGALRSQGRQYLEHEYLSAALGAVVKERRLSIRRVNTSNLREG